MTMIYINIPDDELEEYKKIYAEVLESYQAIREAGGPEARPELKKILESFENFAGKMLGQSFNCFKKFCMAKETGELFECTPGFN